MIIKQGPYNIEQMRAIQLAQLYTFYNLKKILKLQSQYFYFSSSTDV